MYDMILQSGCPPLLHAVTVLLGLLLPKWRNASQATKRERAADTLKPDTRGRGMPRGSSQTRAASPGSRKVTSEERPALCGDSFVLTHSDTSHIALYSVG